MPKVKHSKPDARGRLKIGDDWNAITIIALSQENPLKAIAEMVENSIDAHARQITITRGREGGEHYLLVADDGDGVPKDAEGAPDFRYVATHICDSIKRRLKLDGFKGIQGEFGIGLLSFWTVGEELVMSSGAADGSTHEMRMQKGDPNYSISRRRTLVPELGVRLKIRPLLPGVRRLNGEKIQRYLASELRERIRQSGVRIKVVDRQARKEYAVEPRQFTGRLLHDLPALQAGHGEIYVELYLNEPRSENVVGLYRTGTRILTSLADIEAFQRSPWTEGYLQGIVDVPFLQLTPTTRTGVIHDAAYEDFVQSMSVIETHLIRLLEDQKRAEDELTSRDTLRSIQRAFREALLALPPEEYDWFDINVRPRSPRENPPAASMPGDETSGSVTSFDPIPDANAPVAERQKQFFEFAGPLHSVRISPASSVVRVGETRTLRALARDRSGHSIESDVLFNWRIVNGGGTFSSSAGEFTNYVAPEEPGLVRVAVSATQEQTVCEAEGLLTIVDSLIPEFRERPDTRHGLPGYTFEHAPGQLWRSRFDTEQNLIVVNSGHRDFIFAARTKSLKLKYIARLFAKEMVCRNFPGLPAPLLLERLIELSLYTEEHLR